MSNITTRRFCSTCEQSRLFEKRGPNHVLHLLLSIVTGGLWIPAWILVSMGNTGVPYRCRECGESTLIQTTLESKPWFRSRKRRRLNELLAKCNATIKESKSG